MLFPPIAALMWNSLADTWVSKMKLFPSIIVFVVYRYAGFYMLKTNKIVELMKLSPFSNKKNE